MRRAIAAGVVVVAGVAAAFGAVLVTKSTTPNAPQVSVRPPAPPAPQVSMRPSATPAAQVSAQMTAPPPAPAMPVAEAAPTRVAQLGAPPSAAPAAARPAAPPCNNPDALGVSRVVEIDTTGGPGFGFEHFKEIDFLRDHEVVLTFDDGPWTTTPAVLKALADQCVRAVFFPIGKHATYYPDILRQVAAAGHTVGSHTWSHADLLKKTQQEAKDEIEKGLSAVHWALQGAPHAPFFRFPDLRHPPEMVTYLGTRNIAIFSTDMDSFDFKLRKPEQVVQSVMSKLQKHGKGIVLMHDFQRHTSEAMPALLAQLKAGGYHIVHMVPKDNAVTLPEYDESIPKEVPGGLQTVSSRPASSVVRTIEGN
jgi:peptidoglycan/xylan/chitin deacetylase (PgdA/CDA1 family)